VLIRLRTCALRLSLPSIEVTSRDLQHLTKTPDREIGLLRLDEPISRQENSDRIATRNSRPTAFL
jgi:hypothetical protein